MVIVIEMEINVFLVQGKKREEEKKKFSEFVPFSEQKELNAI
jgi:hypothetical protein